MSNWADLDYFIQFKNNNDLLEFYSILYHLQLFFDDTWSATSNFHNPLWFGNIMYVLGCDLGNYDYYRGEVVTFSKASDNFGNPGIILNCSSANYESTGFRKAIKDSFPGCSVLYMITEPGNAIYLSNDIGHKFFNTKYILNSDYLDTDEELKRMAGCYLAADHERYLACDIEEIKKLIKEDKELYLHEFEYIQDD